jgi:hypothetical protein
VLAILATARASSAAPPATPPVWVWVAGALECPHPASVLAALRQRLGVERIRTGEAPSGSLELRIEPHGARGVSARLAQAGVAIVERTIDVDAGECAGLAETLALVTDSWLPAASEGGPVIAPSRATARGSGSAEGAPSGAVPTEATRTPTSDPTRGTPVPASPRAAALAQPGGSVAEPGGSVAEPGGSVAEPGPGTGASSLPLALEFALGSALGIDTILNETLSRSPVLLGRVGAELNFSPWRIGLRGQLETPGDLDAPGTISIRRSSIDILLGADIHRTRRWALGTSLAAGVDVLAVNANYTLPVPGALLQPSAAAGLRGEWRAFSRVALTATLEGVVALYRDRFLGGRDSWRTPRVRARISIGALWHL